MARLMIMSIGGSPEPLKRSIAEHQPERIIFFASHDSILKAGEVLEQTDPKPKTESVITEDPNSLFECYKTARCCVDRAMLSGYSADEIMVDYTGGTKVMTAALILATVGCPYQFNYVGGDVRTKAGLGVVENGHELMYSDMNPWSVFAEEERRQVVLLFNSCRYSAVGEIIRMASTRDLPRDISDYFSFVRYLAEGFLLWEQFNHRKAAESLDKGMKNLTNFMKNHSHFQWQSFHDEVQQCSENLKNILLQTDNLKKSHPVLIDDLLNNARRRISAGRYDDAAARIYRALELYGQIIFEEVAGCSNSNVRRDKIPEAIRDVYIQKYADPQSGIIKLPLHATFQFLQETGHEAGQRYFQKLDEIQKIQSNRNDSILAHGIKSVTKNAVEKILQVVSDFTGFRADFDFPCLPQ
ncbi:MAG: CRISPR-associated protein (Cas_Cas02710) [Syntrophus sp. PtaU1.Bin208]|nr:MAG: CRISPR-associated protein (Cas_Cas02710) [Syntrophus sp. PtaU1.Bin208]